LNGYNFEGLLSKQFVPTKQTLPGFEDKIFKMNDQICEDLECEVVNDFLFEKYASL